VILPRHHPFYPAEVSGKESCDCGSEDETIHCGQDRENASFSVKTKGI